MNAPTLLSTLRRRSLMMALCLGLASFLSGCFFVNFDIDGELHIEIDIAGLYEVTCRDTGDGSEITNFLTVGSSGTLTLQNCEAPLAIRAVPLPSPEPSPTATPTPSPTPPADSADLALTVTDDPDPVWLSLRLRYTTVVVNNGPATATGIVLSATLPFNQVHSFGSSQGSCTVSGNTATCNLGSLAPGSIATMTVDSFNFPLPTFPSSTLTFSAQVTAVEPDPNLSNNLRFESTVVLPS
jgi:hypothetical protein